MRLQVHVLPLQDNRFAGKAPSPSILQGQQYTNLPPGALSFLEICLDTITLDELCSRLCARFARIYPHKPPLNIKKLQDSLENDLDLSYTVGDVFDDKSTNPQNSVVRVLQTPSTRDSSIPPQSALRPHMRAQKRSFGGLGNLNEENDSVDGKGSGVRTGRANKRQRLREITGDDADEIDPNRPIVSTERDPVGIANHRRQTVTNGNVGGRKSQTPIASNSQVSQVDDSQTNSPTNNSYHYSNLNDLGYSDPLTERESPKHQDRTQPNANQPRQSNGFRDNANGESAKSESEDDNNELLHSIPRSAMSSPFLETEGVVENGSVLARSHDPPLPTLNARNDRGKGLNDRTEPMTTPSNTNRSAPAVISQSSSKLKRPNPSMLKPSARTTSIREAYMNVYDTIETDEEGSQSLPSLPPRSGKRPRLIDSLRTTGNSTGNERSSAPSSSPLGKIRSNSVLVGVVIEPRRGRDAEVKWLQERDELRERLGDRPRSRSGAENDSGSERPSRAAIAKTRNQTKAKQKELAEQGTVKKTTAEIEQGSQELDKNTLQRGKAAEAAERRQREAKGAEENKRELQRQADEEEKKRLRELEEKAREAEEENRKQERIVQEVQEQQRKAEVAKKAKAEEARQKREADIKKRKAGEEKRKTEREERARREKERKEKAQEIASQNALKAEKELRDAEAKRLAKKKADDEKVATEAAEREEKKKQDDAMPAQAMGKDANAEMMQKTAPSKPSFAESLGNQKSKRLYSTTPHIPRGIRSLDSSFNGFSSEKAPVRETSFDMQLPLQSAKRRSVSFAFSDEDAGHSAKKLAPSSSFSAYPTSTPTPVPTAPQIGRKVTKVYPPGMGPSDLKQPRRNPTTKLATVTNKSAQANTLITNKASTRTLQSKPSANRDDNANSGSRQATVTQFLKPLARTTPAKEEVAISSDSDSSSSNDSDGETDGDTRNVDEQPPKINAGESPQSGSTATSAFLSPSSPKRSSKSPRNGGSSPHSPVRFISRTPSKASSDSSSGSSSSGSRSPSPDRSLSNSPIASRLRSSSVRERTSEDNDVDTEDAPSLSNNDDSDDQADSDVSSGSKDAANRLNNSLQRGSQHSGGSQAKKATIVQSPTIPSSSQAKPSLTAFPSLSQLSQLGSQTLKWDEHDTSSKFPRPASRSSAQASIKSTGPATTKQSNQDSDGESGSSDESLSSDGDDEEEDDNENKLPANRLADQGKADNKVARGLKGLLHGMWSWKSSQPSSTG